MTDKKEKVERKEATHFIDELLVYKVDLVKSPATRDKFLTVRGTEGDVLGRAVSEEEISTIRKALLENNDLSVLRLGKAVEPSDSDAEEVTRDENQKENEMATKESKLIPKDKVEREEPEVKEPEVEEEASKEEEKPEEAKRDDKSEDKPEVEELVEQKVNVTIDMSRTEESISKLDKGLGTIIENTNKIIERNEKLESNVTELTDKIDKLNTRIDELERSSEVTNSLPEDEGEQTTEEVKRGEEKSFWGSVLKVG